MSHDRGCFKCGEDSLYYDDCKRVDCPKREVKMNNDFGFSLVSEEEIRKHEVELSKRVEEQKAITDKVHESVASLSGKIDGIRKMVMPLLNNLAKDPDKTYILWPDRAAKMTEFIKKLNDYIDS